MFGLSKPFSAFIFSQCFGLPTRFLEATSATFMISSSLLSRCFQGSGLRNQRPLPTAVEMDRLVERLVVLIIFISVKWLHLNWKGRDWGEGGPPWGGKWLWPRPCQQEGAGGLNLDVGQCIAMVMLDATMIGQAVQLVKARLEADYPDAQWKVSYFRCDLQYGF